MLSRVSPNPLFSVLTRPLLGRRIPHYHAQEATNAIRPLLGDYYHVDKSSWWGALYIAFTQCQWVEADVGKTAQAVSDTAVPSFAAGRRYTRVDCNITSN